MYILYIYMYKTDSRDKLSRTITASHKLEHSSLLNSKKIKIKS